MSSYRRSINCLRGVAALVVVAYHFHFFSEFPWRETYPVFSVAYIGVDFFFLLSGLIIAHVYLEQFRSPNLALYWKFLSRRIARLFPVHAVVLLFMLILPLLYYGGFTDGPFVRYGLENWLQQLSMFRLWIAPVSLTWNVPAWSISAEMFAYVTLFPAYALFASAGRGRMQATLLFVIGVLGVALMAETWDTLNRIRFGGGLLRITLEFATGVGLYGILSRLDSTRSAWNRLAMASFIILLVLAINYQTILNSRTPFVNDSLFFIAIIGLVAGVYNASGRLAAILASAPLFYLGEISYGIYIVHLPLFRAAREVTDRLLGAGHRGVIFCLVVTLAVVCVAAILHHLVELPARTALRHKLDSVGTRLFTKG